MAKIVFVPISVIGSLIAGFLAKKIFEQVWGLIDEEEPPESEHRRASWGKLIVAAALEGAILRAVRIVADHSSRKAFAGVTGSWPGAEEPEPE
ncbi:MAG TPA: DUF4235 domain-containing protein [Thermoleophilaceae bacterium]|nr:DUF4235 domain-containing protein [Thermoleophilaceae bacterium]